MKELDWPYRNLHNGRQPQRFPLPADFFYTKSHPRRQPMSVVTLSSSTPLDTFLDTDSNPCKTCQLLAINPLLRTDLDRIAERLKAGTTNQSVTAICKWLHDTHSYPFKRDALRVHLLHHHAKV